MSLRFKDYGTMKNPFTTKSLSIKAIKDILISLYEDFMAKRVLASASRLTYSTLLALVPILAIHRPDGIRRLLPSAEGPRLLQSVIHAFIVLCCMLCIGASGMPVDKKAGVTIPAGHTIVFGVGTQEGNGAMPKPLPLVINQNALIVAPAGYIRIMFIRVEGRGNAVPCSKAPSAMAFFILGSFVIVGETGEVGVIAPGFMLAVIYAACDDCQGLRIQFLGLRLHWLLTSFRHN